MKAEVQDMFEDFYRREERRVRRLAYGVLGDRTLAQDAAQEAWLRFLRYVERPWPRFDEALLVTVALNAARDMARRRRRRPEQPVGFVEAAHPPGDGDPDIADAVRRLPPREREAVLLHYALDLPLETCARVLKEPEGTLKSRLFRARRHLRQALFPEEAASDDGR